ncbi:androgen-dependent TFPI-regulating protein-like [Varroa jacobsoni]|uniref:androgen-dependent TFPI-regulating protein-like n=1 Tax=Varroa jacobsoni TaxID=62625 RepID=UPI000BF88447|nr:androgen-dependent TFPI-regulating protein-like [Varroa jacobsoni]
MTAAGLQAPPPVARLFQFVAFSVYTYTIYYSVFYVNVPPLSRNYAIAGKAKFLTQWNLLIRLRDFLFCSICLPSCIFVSTVFWGLYAIDRELIFPKRVEKYYPNWVNHCSHSLIVVTALVESLLSPHYQPSRGASFKALLTWFTTYLLWVLYLGLIHDVWVYPVMQVLSPVGLTAFFIGCFIIVLALHLAVTSIIGLCSSRAAYTERTTQREE